jgi:hypothetical protein
VTKRWIACGVGLLFILLSITVTFLPPQIGDVRSSSLLWKLLACVGLFLIRGYALPSMAPTLLRFAYGALSLLVVAFISGAPGSVSTSVGQGLWLLTAAFAIGAVGSAVSRRARRVAYGLIFAGLWAFVIGGVFRAVTGGAGMEMVVAVALAILLYALTILYTVWAKTGLPPERFREKLHMTDEYAASLFGTPLNRVIPRQTGSLSAS